MKTVFSADNSSRKMTEITQKIPWRRAELAVNRFVKTAETDVARLRQFKRNILQHEKNGDRTLVKSELSRAQQTITQLKRNLESIQKISVEIQDTDVSKFDSEMTQTRSWIFREINSFADLDTDLLEYVGEEFHELLKTGLSSPEPVVQYGKQLQVQQEVKVVESQLSAQLQVTEDQQQHIEQIVEDAEHVKDMMSTLSGLVKEQGEAVNSIEQNVETAHTNIKEGGLNLNKAVIAKTAGYTMVGALCGVLVGGPIGLLAGAKLGALAGGAGMTIGAMAGKKLKAIQREANEVELQNLNAAADMADTKALRKETAKPGEGG